MYQNIEGFDTWALIRRNQLQSIYICLYLTDTSTDRCHSEVSMYQSTWHESDTLCYIDVAIDTDALYIAQLNL